MAGAWRFAAVSYLLVLLNLSPLLEYEGYYRLIDWLERTNLRRDAIAWLGRGLPTALRRPSLFRGHGIDLAYGAAAVAYIAGLTTSLMTGYRLIA